MRLIAAVVAALLTTVGARAADRPVVAPPPDWVVAVSPKYSAEKLGGKEEAAVHVLLVDQQAHMSGGANATYIHFASRAQTPQGLSLLGNVQFAWQPDTDVLTVHYIRLRRGGEVSDLLKDAKDLTVLRRENNLEGAALDGVLTATLQPAGLQIGDTVEVAFTIERRDLVLAGHADQLFAGWAGLPIDRLYLAAGWDASRRVRLRATDLPAPGVKVNGNSLTLDATNVAPLIVPTGAPRRFLIGRQLEMSDFADWSDVSAIFEPLFAKARALAADSALRSEIAKIKTTSPDLRIQAAAALALVQNQVRYVYLGMNGGNLTPASADLTWQRRFGDCKGKTALLLALLDGLGIKAQPALVSTLLGDGLDERLPAISPFDHVLVRAVVNGQVYWLDGTRLGDRTLDRVRVPALGWALPVQAAGARLEKLAPARDAVPNSRVDVQLDATDGVTLPAKARVETVFSGDLATQIWATIANLPAANRDVALRDYWRGQYDFIKPDKVDASYDEATGDLRLTLDGSAAMDWHLGKGYRPYYELDGASLGWRADFVRAAGPHANAPFAVDFPASAKATETILLPNSGAGFRIDDLNVDRTVAGRRFIRRVYIKGGRLRMEASTESLASEFPASEATAASAALRELADARVNLYVDDSYRETHKENLAVLAKPASQTAEDHLRRGYAFMREAHNPEAIAEYDAALALKPDLLEALLAKAELTTFLGKDDIAKEAANRALALHPRDIRARKVLAMISSRVDGLGGGLKQINDVLADAPGDTRLLYVRATLRKQNGDIDGALADAAKVLKADPADASTALLIANIQRERGNKIAAADAMRALVAAAPDSDYAWITAGAMLTALGLTDEGDRAFDRALAISPSPAIYVNRAKYRPMSQATQAIADAKAALAMAPDDPAILGSAAAIFSKFGDGKAALPIYRKLLKIDPHPDPGYRISYGVAAGKVGDLATARRELDEVRASASDNGALLNNLCWQQATAGLFLEQALADCHAALKVSPSANVLDSLGFVLLKLGRNAEAITQYDAALKAPKNKASTLFGRGVARLRVGDEAGKADLAAARVESAQIDEDFRSYGIEPPSPPEGTGVQKHQP